MTAGVRLLLDGVDVGDERTWRGVEESHEPLEPAVLRRTCNGQLRRLRSRRREKLAVSLSASGDRAYPPALDGLRPGQVCQLHSSVWLSTRPGVALRRPAVPRPDGGSYDETRPDAHGGTIRLYRPVIDVVLVAVSITGAVAGRDAGWSVSFEEI